MKGIKGKRPADKPSSLPHKQLSTILASRDEQAIGAILATLEAMQELLIPGRHARPAR